MSTKTKYKKVSKEPKKYDERLRGDLLPLLEYALEQHKLYGTPLPPWFKGWEGNHLIPQSIQGILEDGTVKTNDYNGINVTMLGLLASLRGHTSPRFATWKMVTNHLNGKVRKGAKSYPVFFYKFIHKHVETGEKLTDKEAETLPKELVKTTSFIKYHSVFNEADIEGVDLSELKTITVKSWDIQNPEIKPNEKAQAIFDNMPNRPTVNMSDGDRNFYSPSEDTVVLVKPEYYKSNNEYWSTVFHELGHSTAHATRLNLPEKTGHQFGNAKYAFEELRAEFTATMLCNRIGIEDTQENSVAYLLGWIQSLKNDPKMFYKAFKKATEAVEYIDPS